jgi:hypothetical protein
MQKRSNMFKNSIDYAKTLRQTITMKFLGKKTNKFKKYFSYGIKITANKDIIVKIIKMVAINSKKKIKIK